MEKLILLQSLIPNFDIPSQFFCFVYAADTSGSFSLFLYLFSSGYGHLLENYFVRDLFHHTDMALPSILTTLNFFFPQVFTKSHSRFWEHQGVQSLGIEIWTLERLSFYSGSPP